MVYRLPPLLGFVPISSYFILAYNFQLMYSLTIKTIHQDQYRLLGENVAKLRTDLMKERVSSFHSQLEDFARKHKVCSIDYLLLPYVSQFSVRLKASVVSLDFVNHINLIQIPRSLNLNDKSHGIIFGKLMYNCNRLFINCYAEYRLTSARTLFFRS